MFSKNIQEKGVAYVPFIKTEKEAIIPTGTPLTRTGKRFFFKFEGRTIPIFEYTAGTGSVGETKNIFGRGYTTLSVYTRQLKSPIRSTSYAELFGYSYARGTPSRSYVSLGADYSYAGYKPSKSYANYYGGYSPVSYKSYKSTASYLGYSAPSTAYAPSYAGSSSLGRALSSSLVSKGEYKYPTAYYPGVSKGYSYSYKAAKTKGKESSFKLQLPKKGPTRLKPSRKIKQPTRYVANIYAADVGITGEMPSAFGKRKGFVTGFEIRPLLTKGKKKKRRR